MTYKPEDFWVIDGGYEEMYHRKVDEGRKVAHESQLAVVGLARNCAKNLRNTLELLSELSEPFFSTGGYVFENDSVDGTKEILNRYKPEWVTVKSQDLNRPHLPGEFQGPRTEALAEYRNSCVDWVKENASHTDFVVVLDLDADGGFSIDGVLNSIGWLVGSKGLAGLGSFSLARITSDGVEKFSHYDAFAARLNWWRDRREEIGSSWFHTLLPPAGSPPFIMNSCFGGLAVYKTQAFVEGTYSGNDCEHVMFHKTLAARGWSLALNPGSRFAALLQ